MSRPAVYDPNHKLMERHRSTGAALATREQMDGETDHLRHRDPERWAGLNVWERGGYNEVRGRFVRELGQTFCVAHHYRTPCVYCARTAREAADRAGTHEPVEVTRERVLAAEGRW